MKKLFLLSMCICLYFFGQATVTISPTSSVSDPINAVRPAIYSSVYKSKSVSLSDAALKIQKNTLKRTKTSVSSTTSVLVLGTPDGFSNDVVNKLFATSLFNTVDYLDVSSSTPTLAQLQAYNAVLIFTDYPPGDPTTLGDNLAAYIEGGGGVVSAICSFSTGFGIGGKFHSDYELISSSNIQSLPRLTLGVINLPSHVLMQGVTTFDGGSSSYRALNPSLTSGSTVVSCWSDGQPLIIYKSGVGPMSVNRVDLNFFPASSDVRADFWNSATDGVRIMTNALQFVAGVIGSNIAPTVTTQAVTAITTTTATGNGNITNLGVPNPTQFGVVWSTTSGTETTTTYLGKTSQGAATVTGSFTSSITSLTPGTTYYVKAYATNDVNTVYGTEVSFTTLKIPTVTTQAVTGISPTTGIGNGNITDLGNPSPSQYGVVWSKVTGPTTTSHVKGGITVQGPASITGAFTSYMTGLYPNTKYYVKTYATNTAGTVYGSEVSFTTPNTPEASTQAVTGITPTSAIGNGTIIDLGNPTATKYGMVWSTHEYPTTDENKTEVVGGSIGTFTSAITGLTPNTKYYVRAYATNSIGTNYGGELVSFTTLLSTGLNQTGLLNVEIYPNPTSEGIYVNAGESVAALSLCDLSGRILLVKQLIGNTYVNISQLAKGVYIAKISTQSGTIEKKILKK